MSGYESAPGTKLLATHCAICARPLLDAVSVERGIGPDCAEKWGYWDGAPEDSRARQEANQYVYSIALEASGVRPFDPQAFADRVAMLRILGFDKLAGRLEERVVKVDVSTDADSRIAVKTPYNQGFVERVKQLRGRKWDPERKVWTVPASDPNVKVILHTLLKAYYPGVVARGSKGLFVIAA